MKTCSKCDETKNLADFAKKSRAKDGLRPQCKKCDQAYRDDNQEAVRDYHYKKRYGISLEEYRAKLEEQGGCCAICGTSHSEHSRMKTLVVDHCHKTGKVRGLLCHGCNVALGAAKEREDVLMACISYLRTYNKETDV
jgi:DNA repair exonuclease SbcCD ATPase subunit